MEGLRYAAMLEAGLDAIAGEAERRFGIGITRAPPIVKLLAPCGWWRQWLDLTPAGNWDPALAHLIAAVERETGVVIDCMALEGVDMTYGLDGRAPRLDRVPALFSVHLDAEPPIGAALSLPVSGIAGNTWA